MDGTTIEGKFESGALNGKGKITYKTGEVFEGQVIDNQIGNYGKLTNR